MESDDVGFSNASNSSSIIQVDFESIKPGIFNTASLKAVFESTAPWSNGLEEGRAEIVQEERNQFLRIGYVGNEFGPSRGGVQFSVPLSKAYSELFLSYRLRFSDGFDFVREGKLPGFVGGTAPTGCVSDKHGFSARNMWRGGGVAVQYLYSPNKISACGDDYIYKKDGVEQKFTTGRWQTIEHRLVMNTPGLNDGVLQAWIDGQLV
ncbi:MAG: hypothetical protein ACI93R_000896 [Flavobacteriales bacterium]|jgi:hypothetical protein